VADGVTQTKSSAETMLAAFEDVENATAKLRGEVEEFLKYRRGLNVIPGRGQRPRAEIHHHKTAIRLSELSLRRPYQFGLSSLNCTEWGQILSHRLYMENC